MVGARRAPDAEELVRRADWRFLLRASAPPRTVNLASGGLGRATGAVFDVVDPGAGGADLAVLGRAGRAARRRAFAALRPGGELYCEWRLPLPARRAWARRALARAGFDEIRLLWPGPRPSHPQFWLPIDSPAAVAGVLSA